MKFCFFSNKFDVDPKSRDIPWSEFVKGIIEEGHQYVYENKNDVPMLCPATFDPPKRKKANAQALSMAVLDCDDLSDMDASRLADRLEGLECVVYTSWSHARAQVLPAYPPAVPAPRTGKAPRPTPRHRLRVILPLTQPVQASDWVGFWERLRLMFDGLIDTACKDPSRIYAIPAAPPGTEEHNWIEHQSGQWLDPEEILSQSISDLRYDPEIRHTITAEDLERLARKLQRRSNLNIASVGDAMLAVARMEEYAPDNERNDMQLQIVGEILKVWPHVDAKCVGELFRPSIDLINKINGTKQTPETVIDQLERKREDKAKAERDAEQAQEQRTVERIRQAFRGRRATSYTQEELDEYAEDAGVDTDTFLGRLIVQRRGSFWVWVAGTYEGPFIRDELVVQARTLLAPARPWGVHVDRLDEHGEIVCKSADRLMSEYGMAVNSAEVSLELQVSHFDRDTRALQIAACPMRDLSPRYDADVARWLELFAGEMHEKLIKWIAFLPRLDDPIAALYLCGPPSSGKTLLAHGLARLWTTNSATPMDQITGAFNESLQSCPLVFADESLPEEFSGRRGTGKLREFIDTRSHKINRKFHDVVHLKGCARLIMAANNDNLISTREELTQSDIEAISQRLLYIEVGQDAVNFLRRQPDLGASFRFGDRIARHALWLQSQPFTPDGRYLVAGTYGRLHRKLTTSTGTREDVCAWLVGFILDRSNVESNAKLKPFFRIFDGEIYAISRGLVEGWSVYKTHRNPPPRLKDIGVSLRSLAVDGKRVKIGGKKFYHVDRDKLLDWADEADYASRDELEEALQRDFPANPHRRAVN